MRIAIAAVIVVSSLLQSGSVTDVVALKPKAVVILAGTNDVAGNTGPMSDEDIQGNLASMAELAKANGIRQRVSRRATGGLPADAPTTCTRISPATR